MFQTTHQIGDLRQDGRFMLVYDGKSLEHLKTGRATLQLATVANQSLLSLWLIGDLYILNEFITHLYLGAQPCRVILATSTTAQHVLVFHVYCMYCCWAY